MLGQASIPTHTVLHDADKDSLLALQTGPLLAKNSAGGCGCWLLLAAGCCILRLLLLMLLPPLQLLGPLQLLLLLMLLLHDAARASSVR